MPNLSQNLSGITAAELTITGAASIGGRVTGAGFTSSVGGTAATPAYNWSTGVHASGPSTGHFHEGTRVAIGYSGADKMFWGASINNYVATTFAGSTQFNNTVAVDGGNLTMGTGRKLILDSATDVTNCALQFAGDPNTGMVYNSTDQYRMVAGGAFIISPSNAGGLILGTNLITANSDTIFTKALGFNETTAPAAVADRSWIYALDVAGKTQLTSKNGAAGTVVALAIEV